MSSLDLQPHDSTRTDHAAQRRRIIVASCPRSGSSLFAKWLVAAGLRTVRDDRRRQRYPAGFFEHLPALMFNKAMERLTGPVDRITSEPFVDEEHLDDPFVDHMFREAYQPLLSDEVDFLKMPTLMRAPAFALQQFEPAHIIALWRDPATTYRSLLLREYSPSALPGSAMRCVLLWNVYADWIVRAARQWPDQVTVLNIDALVQRNPRIAPLLHRLGYPQARDVPIRTSMDSGLWRRRLPWRWRLGYTAANSAVRVVGPRVKSRWGQLYDTKAILRDLTSVTASAESIAVSSNPS